MAATDETSFTPHADDHEFDGRFERFRPTRVVIACLVSLAVAIFVLRAAVSRRSLPKNFEPASTLEVEELITLALEDPAERVAFFLGDSVLRGGALAARGHERWREDSVIGQVRDLVPGDVSFAVYDLSFDGMLPADMLELIRRIESRDPEGRIELTVELSPRYLSRAYSGPGLAFARPWLATPKAAESPIRSLANRFVPAGMGRHRLGLANARIVLPETVRRPENCLRPLANTVPAGADPMAAALHRWRIAGHFLDLDFGDDSVQVRALREIGAMAASSARSSLFFLCPLNAAYLVSSGDRAELPEAGPFLAGLVDDGESLRVQVRSFDDHAFPLETFLDHCHLTPSGNERLALRILGSLDVPVRDRGDRAAWTSPADAALRYICGDVKTGQRDGFGSEVRLGRRKAAACAGSGKVLLSDLDAKTVRVMNPIRGSVRTLYATESEVGIDRPLPSALARASGGGIVAVEEESGLLFRFEDADDARPDLIPGPAEPPWRGDEVLLAADADRVIVYARASRMLWSVLRADGEVTSHGALPEVHALRDWALAGDGSLWLLTESSSLVRTDLASLAAGDLAGARLIAIADANRFDAYWRERELTHGLKGPALRGTEFVLGEPSQVFVSSGGDFVYVADRRGRHALSLAPSGRERRQLSPARARSGRPRAFPGRHARPRSGAMDPGPLGRLVHSSLRIDLVGASIARASSATHELVLRSSAGSLRPAPRFPTATLTDRGARMATGSQFSEVRSQAAAIQGSPEAA